MRVLIFLAALFALISYVYAGNWAVIVAGSNTYGNYRHQSDACHAYQICKKFGIPENQIILMAYDDIANDKQNPFPGKIFNKPTATGTPGTDVYAGCKFAYSKDTVTAANFLAVIQGDASKVPAGHPVLNTTAEDNIFIYYTDHGAVGIVAMPVGDDLYATDLNTALQSMYKAKKFGKLVFYLEACESGSMFEGILPTNINIYATTASSAEESSYGTYCPPDDMVNGKEINSCLGDEYSVNWMENSDSAGAKETIADQITIVTQETKLSGVHQYGSTSFTNLAIGQFQGGMNNATSRRSFDALEQAFAKRAALNSQGSKIDSRDIALHLAYSKYQRAVARKAPAAEVESALNALQAELATRGYADEFFNLLSTTIKADGSLSSRSTLPVTGTACQKAVDSAIGKCSVWNDYSRKYHNIVVNACMDPEACSASLVDTVNSVCAQLPKPANYKF